MTLAQADGLGCRGQLPGMTPRRQGRTVTLWFVYLATRVRCVCLVNCGEAFAVTQGPYKGPKARKAQRGSRHAWHGARGAHCQQGVAVAAIRAKSSPWQAWYDAEASRHIGPGIVAVAACFTALGAMRSPRLWSGSRTLRTALATARGHALTVRQRGRTRGRAPTVRQRGRTRLAAEPGTTPAALPAEVSEEDQKEAFRALCTTLLPEMGKVEAIRKEIGFQESVSFAEFKELLLQLKISCSDADAQKVFNILDLEGSGSIEVHTMKRNLRVSGVISELYNEGIQNALLTLIPTALIAVGFTVYSGVSSGLDFIAGYVVEDSLSVDNLFVFLIIFKYFKVPPNLQKLCLDIGIYGAVVLRAIFIYLGLAAVNSFRPVLLVFAFILLYASFRLIFDEEEEDADDDGVPEVIKAIAEIMPTTSKFVGNKLFITQDDGTWVATPLALCILSIELCDILFAVDSVPAVFAVTEDPLIVFASNITAILGLRSLYQILSIAVQDLAYLEKSIAIILGFVGIKLVAEVAGFTIGSAASLAFIVAILGGGIGLSLLGGDDDVEVSSILSKEGKIIKKKSSIERLAEWFNDLLPD